MTLLYDRMKEPIFAMAQIPEFWIVNLVENVIEVYRRPAGKHFAEKTIYAADESISPLCAPEFALTLKEILPR